MSSGIPLVSVGKFLQSVMQPVMQSFAQMIL
jgi:hypothetical protein